MEANKISFMQWCGGKLQEVASFQFQNKTIQTSPVAACKVWWLMSLQQKILERSLLLICIHVLGDTCSFVDQGLCKHWHLSIHILLQDFCRQGAATSTRFNQLSILLFWPVHACVEVNCVHPVVTLVPGQWVSTHQWCSGEHRGIHCRQVGL